VEALDSSIFLALSDWLLNIQNSSAQAHDMVLQAMTFEDHVWRLGWLSTKVQDSMPRAELRFPLVTNVPSMSPHAQGITRYLQRRR
jgi:hypothetical protein